MHVVVSFLILLMSTNDLTHHSETDRKQLVSVAGNSGAVNEKMDIKEMVNGTTLLVMTPAQLKEFALTVIDEAKKEQCQDEDNKLYNPQQFAAKHHVDVSTLYRWRKAGILKATQVGGKVWYKESNLKKEVV